jgi:hypothetical protein
MSGLRRLKAQLCAAVEASIAGEKPRPPEAGIPLWNAFHRLSAQRTFHAVGPNPIQPADIVAFCGLHRLPLPPHHVAIILAMDAAWLEAAHRRTRAAPEGVKTLPPVSKRPISAALLDAVLG